MPSGPSTKERPVCPTGIAARRPANRSNPIIAASSPRPVFLTKATAEPALSGVASTSIQCGTASDAADSTQGWWRIARPAGSGGTAGISAEPSRDTMPVTRTEPVPSSSRLRSVARPISSTATTEPCAGTRTSQEKLRDANPAAVRIASLVAPMPSLASSAESASESPCTSATRPHHSRCTASEICRSRASTRLRLTAVEVLHQDRVNEGCADQDGPGYGEDQRIGEADLTAERTLQSHALTSLRARQPLPCRP